MRKLFDTLLIIIVSPFIILGVYLLFLWGTYIDNTVESGTNYGFTIGTTKDRVYKDILIVNKQYPKLKIYINYGDRAGDNITLSPTKNNFDKIKKYNRWEILLDGDGEYHNVIRLYYAKNNLNQIYRHRKYFELP